MNARVSAAIPLAGFTVTAASTGTQTTSGARYSCSTNPNLANQAATLDVTASDSVDLATPDQAETNRFTTAFHAGETTSDRDVQGPRHVPAHAAGAVTLTLAGPIAGRTTTARSCTPRRSP